MENQRVEDIVDYNEPQDNVRTQRSTEGADALLRSVLQHLLGVTGGTAESILHNLETTGEIELVRNNLKLLSMSAHSRLNQILDAVETMSPSDFPDEDIVDGEIDDAINIPTDGQDDEDSELEQEYNPANNTMERSGLRPKSFSNWNPKEDRTKSTLDRSASQRPTDPEDFSEDRRGIKESFMGYLLRENNIRQSRTDAEISAMNAAEDTDLDDNTLRRVKQAEQSGNVELAAKLRNQAKMRNGNSQSQQPQQNQTPSQRRIDQKKKELADALARERRMNGGSNNV